MVIKLVAARSAEDFGAAVLRARAAKAPRLDTTRLFRAMAGSEEMALVVLDVHPGERCSILYELFLCTERRNRGVGSKVLAAIEAFVVASGQECLEVWPRTLDVRSRSDAQLEGWYRRHGFVSAKTGSPRLVKKVIPG